ncbi:MAG: hypothetical protein KGM42_13980 [Hyphomicrobiales bacterium]|nr:hypothetical protein [Hyphomicrobiales bacterium]
MSKLVSALGLLVALSLGAIAWIGLPATGVMASTDRTVAAVACGSDIALDEGYGVSRHVLRDCAR